MTEIPILCPEFCPLFYSDYCPGFQECDLRDCPLIACPKEDDDKEETVVESLLGRT